MSYDPLDSKLLEIESHLRDLTPEERDKVLDWIKKGKQRAANTKKAVQELSNSFDTLRVIVKYLVFDLEATRRENQELQEMVAQLQRVLEGHGYYASEDVEPQPEGGLIDIPEVGDFIHNDECDHPYDSNCYCDHCEAMRERSRQQNEGAD